MFVAIIVLIAVVLVASCAGPMISRTEYFRDNNCQMEPESLGEDTVSGVSGVEEKSCEMNSVSELVGKHRMRPHISQVEKNTEHIEDIRKVLSHTIRSLEKDDVLPSGSNCSCSSAPVLSGETGEIEASDRCKPPGWLRMMNTRNEMDEKAENCN